MADRFPLIVNAVSQKIEELISGDNLELTGNNIIISGDTGSGKYLTSDGTVVSWGSPGDVYLTQAQTLTNKSLTAPVLTGSSSSAGSIIFKEDTDNGTNSATLKGPAATADVTLTLPATDGTVSTESFATAIAVALG